MILSQKTHVQRRFFHRDDRNRRPSPVRRSQTASSRGRNAVMKPSGAGGHRQNLQGRGGPDANLGHIASTARNKRHRGGEAEPGASWTHRPHQEDHQGVIAVSRRAELRQRGRHLSAAREKGGVPLIVVCDELSDPHNRGGDSARECPGPRGSIHTKRRSAGLPPPSWPRDQRRAGVTLPVARVPNLTAALKS